MASTATSIQIDQPAHEIILSLAGKGYPSTVVLTCQPRAGYRGLATGDTLTWTMQNALGLATGASGICTIGTGATGVLAGIPGNGAGVVVTAVAKGKCLIQCSDTAYDDWRPVQVIA